MGAFQVGEKIVERFTAHSDALGFEIGRKFGDRELAGRAAEQAAHEPAEGGEIGDAMAFDQIAEEQHVDIALAFSRMICSIWSSMESF